MTCGRWEKQWLVSAFFFSSKTLTVVIVIVVVVMRTDVFSRHGRSNGTCQRFPSLRKRSPSDLRLPTSDFGGQAGKREVWKASEVTKGRSKRPKRCRKGGLLMPLGEHVGQREPKGGQKEPFGGFCRFRRGAHVHSNQENMVSQR